MRYPRSAARRGARAAPARGAVQARCRGAEGWSAGCSDRRSRAPRSQPRRARRYRTSSCSSRLDAKASLTQVFASRPVVGARARGRCPYARRCQGEGGECGGAVDAAGLRERSPGSSRGRRVCGVQTTQRSERQRRSEVHPRYTTADEEKREEKEKQRERGGKEEKGQWQH